MTNLAGSLRAAIGTFREAQSALFVDEATISRRTGAPIFNPDTNTYTYPTVSIYSGVCLIRMAEAFQQEEVQAGQTESSVTRFLAKFPVDTPAELGDVVTVLDSTFDAGLVGRELVVVDVQHDGWQISRRLVLEENRG